MKSPIQLFIAIAILLATATVAAQVYKWVDKDGQVQYSDAPPPAGAAKAEAKKVETSAPVASGSPAASTTPAKTLQDRAKDYDKRRAAATEGAKKAEVARKNDETADENCKSARTRLRDLESGRPIRQTNEKGEINLMPDEEREAELAKAKAAAASCKA